jgi:hypothetical protein
VGPKIKTKRVKCDTGFATYCTVDAGLNATLDTGSVMFKILFAIFVPGPTTPGIEVITKLDVAHQAPPATVGLYA